jgi:hypothetical protein
MSTLRLASQIALSWALLTVAACGSDPAAPARSTGDDDSTADDDSKADDDTTDDDTADKDAGKTSAKDAGTTKMDAGTTKTDGGAKDAGATTKDGGAKDAGAVTGMDSGTVASDAGSVAADAGKPDTGTPDAGTPDAGSKSDAGKADSGTSSAGECGGATPHGCFVPESDNPEGCPPQIHEQSAFYPPMDEWEACSSRYYTACKYTKPGGGAPAHCECDLGLHWLCTYGD